MSEPKFTPGPYFISGNAIGPRIDSDDQSDGMVSPVARIDRYDWPENWKFNAHLIAAAPDLYEALNALVSVSRLRSAIAEEDINPESPVGKGIAALAKARGEG